LLSGLLGYEFFPAKEVKVPSLLTTSSIMMCPHGAQVMVISGNTRVKAGGDFVVRSTDIFTIVGCPVNIAGAPHPCVQVQWVLPNARSQVISDFTLSESSIGLCLAPDMAPQGPVLINFTQPRVGGH
jgi:hypothetical protein